jgi:adenylate cyclase class 2
MYTEYEATFVDINKDEIRKKLEKAEAKLMKPEFLQKRVVFNLPGGPDGYKWLRVRDEGDKITMSFKEVNGGKIDDQKEINLTIDDFENGVEFLETLGCQKKSYQEIVM